MPDDSSKKQQPGPQDPSKHDKPRHAPADPASPEDPGQQQADQQAQQARQAASKQVFDKLKDKYTDVQKTEMAMFPFEGTCLRCGFHTLELTEDAAKKMIEAHISVHWRDAVAGTQVQGGSGLLGFEGTMSNLRKEAMKAQAEGAAKGGADALKPVQQKEKQAEQKAEQLAKEFAAPQGGGGQSSGGQHQSFGG